LPFILRVIYAYILSGYSWLLNFYGCAAITAPGGPVVSLTSYETRIHTVYLAIESIARGHVLPSRMILWIDDKALFGNLPAAIRRLMQRGLEVKFCKNYGPHKKYYPYLESLQKIEAPLVTADDDVLYPRSWLKRLVEAFQQFPDVVNCYRASVMVMNQEGIAKYDSWELADSTKPSFCHVAGNGAGVIYPPKFLKGLKNAGNAFEDCCPKADDLWLHVQALRAEYKVRKISENQFRLAEIPGTQGTALWNENGAGGNDRQIAATYTAEDIRKLLAN
jgi:hypothetical protein